MQLTIDEHPTPIGPVLLVHDAGSALIALEFSDHAARMQAWLQRHDLPAPQARTAFATAAHRALDAYFAGDLAALDAVTVGWTGTPFQRRCWEALRRIAPGAPASYAAQAQAIGMPRAARAVGRANAMNPIAIVVPCHRVIGTNAALTGYAGGLERKRWLLAHEARHARVADQRAAA